MTLRLMRPLESSLQSEEVSILGLGYLQGKSGQSYAQAQLGGVAFACFLGGPHTTVRNLLGFHRTLPSRQPFPSWRWRVLNLFRVTDRGGHSLVQGPPSLPQLLTSLSVGMLSK